MLLSALGYSYLHFYGEHIAVSIVNLAASHLFRITNFRRIESTEANLVSLLCVKLLFLQ